MSAPKLIDSHCHLDFPDFADELDAVVGRAEESGIAAMVTISTRIRSFDRVLAIAERYQGVFCTVGTHPHHADEEDGIGYGIDLTWTPTLLTTVTASGGGDFRPTTQDEAEANFRSSVGLGVRHELLRNVILAANVDYYRDDFSGIDRTDNTISAGGGVSYLINRNFSVGAGYNYTTRSSDEDDEEFNRNLVRIGVTGRL